MTASAFRRALHARPRLILGVLLALVVQTLSAAGPVGHRHAGGDVRHTHAGQVIGSETPTARRGHLDEAGGVALTSAHADDWHEHDVRATLAGAIVRTTSLESSPAIERAACNRVVAPCSTDGRSTYARGPPARLA